MRCVEWYSRGVGNGRGFIEVLSVIASNFPRVLVLSLWRQLEHCFLGVSVVRTRSHNISNACT